ncbi:Serine/threonine-protein kinase Nek5 [Nymphon striatum]|nr:Serine/threonine-protein kinase Nek5 [Nymphon striatum]
MWLKSWLNVPHLYIIPTNTRELMGHPRGLDTRERNDYITWVTLLRLGMMDRPKRNKKNDHFNEISKNYKVKSNDNEMVMWYFVQIAFALRYIHSKNIIHRDLKAQNIFLAEHDIIKIGDFGISKRLTGSKDFASTAIGTPYYLPPEICQKKKYPFKSIFKTCCFLTYNERYGFGCDIWALGCVLYELSSLKKPFVANSIQTLLIQITAGQYVPLPSSLIHDLVKVLLNVDPDYRPSSKQVLSIPLLQPHIKRYMEFYNRHSLSRSRRNSFIKQMQEQSEETTMKKQKILVPCKAIIKERRKSESKSPVEKFQKRSKSDYSPRTFVLENKGMQCNKVVPEDCEQFEKKECCIEKIDVENRTSYQLDDNEFVDQNINSECTSAHKDNVKPPGWLLCKKCSMQSLWDSRLSAKDEGGKCSSMKRKLVEALGPRNLQNITELLLKIWDQEHSNPVPRIN